MTRRFYTERQLVMSLVLVAALLAWVGWGIWIITTDVVREAR